MPRQAPTRDSRGPPPLTEEQEDAIEARMIDGGAFRIKAQKRAIELTQLEEATPEWIEEMITRVFNEAKRTMTALEESKPDTPAQIATNARSLASLRETLRETTRLRRECQAHNESADGKNDDDIKANLARKFDRYAAAGDQSRADRKPE